MWFIVEIMETMVYSDPKLKRLYRNSPDELHIDFF